MGSLNKRAGATYCPNQSPDRCARAGLRAGCRNGSARRRICECAEGIPSVARPLGDPQKTTSAGPNVLGYAESHGSTDVHIRDETVVAQAGNGTHVGIYGSHFDIWQVQVSYDGAWHAGICAELPEQSNHLVGGGILNRKIGNRVAKPFECAGEGSNWRACVGAV